MLDTHCGVRERSSEDIMIMMIIIMIMIMI